MFLYFSEPLRAMGHAVETFDHYSAAARFGPLRGAELLAKRIDDGAYDVVFYQTSGSEPIDVSLLGPLAKRHLIAAWNSDDDWQWESSTRHIARHFSFMITTYPDVYDANRGSHPNLLLSQWGCFPAYADYSRTKDIDFSFAGQIQGARNHACRFLRAKTGLRCFGRGSRLVALGLPYVRGVFRFPSLSGRSIAFAQLHSIWNRSRVSYTPMGGGPSCEVMQIKGRAFEMGLSGTLMLCEVNPDLEHYYEPGKEYVSFETLDDCADKAKYYLSNEAERRRIAANYRDRTMREHLWEHRFAKLFVDMGLKSSLS